MIKTWWMLHQRVFLAQWGDAFGWVVWSGYLLAQALLFHTVAIKGARLSQDVLADFFLSAALLTSLVSLVLGARFLPQELGQGVWQQLRLAGVRPLAYLGGHITAVVSMMLLYLVSTLLFVGLIGVHGTLSVGQVVTGYLGVVGCGVLSLMGVVWAATWTRHIVATLLVVILVSSLVLLPLAAISSPPFDRFFAALNLVEATLKPMARGQLAWSQLSYFGGLLGLFLVSAWMNLEARR